MTPMEEATLRSADFAAGLAAMQQFKEMLKASKECEMAVNDRELSLDVRAQALKEGRHLNQIFTTVAAARALVGGISA
jgi:hypothetical protein